MLGAAETLWADALDEVSADDLERPSGCGDWTVRRLVDHVAGGAARYTILLEGGSAAETAATRDLDYISADPTRSFWDQEHRLREVAERSDLTVLVDHRAGKRTGESLMQLRLLELTLHSKDLADALGLGWDPPVELLDHLLAVGAPIIEDLRRLGFFGPALPTGPESDAAARLLALAGRPAG
ncbi:TIGR03086 family metal-binding protein [Gordonia sp. (in: high G+C Gram-positive bacteria)]|uniref:TIGR03086 family metal-binding protein n=1 Tax=Gordonia sp. (in: high G+C Gram-positive bacteria) TaxID=84139 RepID=UPI003C7073A8